MNGNRDAASNPAVIVISSHVVRGAVGNRAAVFALESLGFPVWAVPTVTLPWHPGHGRATRLVPDASEFAALINDLAHAPWLGEVGAIMTGYLGSSSQAAPIAALVRALKTLNPDAIYLCDPVIGDASGLYVPETTAAAIRDHLMPLADIATPNRFELGWLTGLGASRQQCRHRRLFASGRADGGGHICPRDDDRLDRQSAGQGERNDHGRAPDCRRADQRAWRSDFGIVSCPPPVRRQ
jgi:hypothetical protein